jgi:hypothetical protein
VPSRFTYAVGGTLFKSGQADRYVTAYCSPMSILRDNCDERQTRVDSMIDEFRKAQSRRLAKATTKKGDDQVVELQPDAHAQASVAGSAATPTSN